MPSTESASNRPGSPYPIRPIEENEFDAFLEVLDHAFQGTPPTEADRRVVLDRFEFDRSLAAFDGTTQAGVTGCFSFQLSVPGAEPLPAAGVSWVSVLPTHRRRGVLSSLMRQQLADVHERGEPWNACSSTVRKPSNSLSSIGLIGYGLPGRLLADSWEGMYVLVPLPALSARLI